MLAAVVILYNPNDSIIENINSYVNSVSLVYIIDNSDCSHEIIFSKTTFKSKLKYVFNNGNLGIARALNIGCLMAINDGMQWVLTMDQDSHFSNKCSEIFSIAIKNANPNVALYYPNYIIGGLVYDKYIKENNEPIAVMTSGNLLNLKIYEKINGFEDKLFIDYVDFEYCLKLKKHGYKIANLPAATLVHELGQSLQKSFFSFKIIITNHSSIRRYYITRNRLYVRKKYRNISIAFYQAEKKIFINDILKIIFFEEDKLSKLKNMSKGFLDYKTNNYGVFNK